ncbi:MAG: hypothetical protein IJR69_10660 [Bacteroidaceae bacterium]|jgi:hypothetical protein|nr:hypothetical protein [Bacteroidaceae bacterium]
MEDFNKFLKALQDKEKAKRDKRRQFDPAERIYRFQTLVSEFFNTLETDWFRDSVAEGLMTIEREQISISEDSLGIYNTEKCRLIMGAEKIEFIPIGTVLLGTDGRIDMVYKRNEVMFVHVGEKVKRASDLMAVLKKIIPSKDLGQKVWKYTPKVTRAHYMTANSQTVKSLIMDLVKAKN